MPETQPETEKEGKKHQRAFLPQPPCLPLNTARRKKAPQHRGGRSERREDRRVNRPRTSERKERVGQPSGEKKQSV